jgi:urease accessory protein
MTTTMAMGMSSRQKVGGRPKVRDGGLRPAPRHEAERAADSDSTTLSPLILGSPPKAGVSKDEGALAPTLYRLMAWLSPAFPVGAFSYSSGIEWAVEAGDIKDAPTLQHWLEVVTAEGGVFCDAAIFANAHRATQASDDASLRAIAEFAVALTPSRERHLETTSQGRAFVEAVSAAWHCAALDRLAAVWDGAVAYPVAVAVSAAGHGIPLASALRAYLHAAAANLISAGVRLVPLGQTDGQRVLAALEPVVTAAAERAMATALDDIGGAAFRADLASMRHETQYTRLFRS